MPQHKQPETLFNLCIAQAQVLIKNSSVNIARRCGRYGKPRNKLAIKEVQQFLLSVVDGFYLDKIFNTHRALFSHRMNFPHIYTSICLHPNMKLMTIPTYFLKWTTVYLDDDYGTYVPDFWKAHLPLLTQLKQLNLNQYCNESVFEVIGQHCLKLEVIEIDSDVSEQGWESLLNCKELKEIKVTPFSRSYDFKYDLNHTHMSTEVACLLLRSLPKLECVFCSSLGDALASLDDVTSLRLVSVTELAVKPHHGRAIARLCPDVKVLKLQNHCEEFDQESDATLTALAESDLKVTDLELSKFSFGPEMKSLLTQKGMFITKLHLNKDMKSLSLSFSDVKFIGNTCPNLKSLHLEAFKILSGGGGTTSSGGGTTSSGGETTTNGSGTTTNGSGTTNNHDFKHLESLTIKAQEWDYSLLHIILTHALNIRSVSFRCKTFTYKPEYDLYYDDDYFVWNYLISLDDALATLLLNNPCQELRSVMLYLGAQITMNTLHQLVDSCPHFRYFESDDCTIYESKGFKRLEKRALKENLDLEISGAAMDLDEDEDSDSYSVMEGGFGEEVLEAGFN